MRIEQSIPLLEHCDDLGVEELEFGGLVTWCGIAFWKPLFIQFITLFTHWNKQFIYILDGLGVDTFSFLCELFL